MKGLKIRVLAIIALFSMAVFKCRHLQALLQLDDSLQFRPEAISLKACVFSFILMYTLLKKIMNYHFDDIFFSVISPCHAHST
jgi:hypothetical protein